MPACRARRQRSMSSANRWIAGSNGPSCLSVPVAAARHAATAHPTVRGAHARKGSTRSRTRRGQQRRVDERGEEGAERAREWVGAALDAAVRVQQPRRVQRVGVVAGSAREFGERAVVGPRCRGSAGSPRPRSPVQGPRCWRRRSPGCRGVRRPPRRTRPPVPPRRRRGRCRRRSAAAWDRAASPAAPRARPATRGGRSRPRTSREERFQAGGGGVRRRSSLRHGGGRPRVRRRRPGRRGALAPPLGRHRVGRGGRRHPRRSRAGLPRRGRRSGGPRPRPRRGPCRTARRRRSGAARGRWRARPGRRSQGRS